MMDSILIAIRSLSEAVTWQGVAWFLVRITVVLAFGHMALVVLTRRAAAATLHLVALAALGAPLAMPLANLVVPAGPVLVVPGRVTSAMPILDRLTATASTASISPPSVGHVSPAAGASESTWDARFEWWVAPAKSVVLALAEPPWSAMLACLVMGVALGLLVRVAVGVAAARRLSRDSTPVGDDRVHADLERACERLSIRRPITVLTSRRLAVPVVVGILRPAVLLPPNALSWPPERRQAMLIHELAHVSRHDAMTLLFGRIATALLWFHPLAWALARIARRECERACDDIVLSTGVRASEYAGHLFAIARGASHHGTTPGFTPAIARQGSLESRLRALLCSRTPRGPATRRTIGVIGSFALMTLLPVASLRVAASPSSEFSLQQAEGRGGNHDLVPVSLDESVHSRDSTSPTPDTGLREAHRVAHARYGELRDARSESAAEWRLVAFALLRTGEPILSADAFQRQYEIDHCPGALYDMACALAIGGQPERAMELLERAEMAGMLVWERARSDPDLASIRSRIAERDSVSFEGAR